MVIQRSSILIGILFFLLCLNANGQKTKSQLEKDKKTLLLELSKTESILKETRGKKQASLGQLRALNHLVRTKESYIKNLEEELGLIEGDAQELEEIITSMEADLDSLKMEYAEMIYEASTIDNGYNKLMLLFSSQNYYQLNRRMNFLSQFAEARKTQVQKITLVKESLVSQRESLSDKKSEMTEVLSKLKSERAETEKLRIEARKVYGELKGQEDEIRKKIKRLNAQKKKVEDAIKKAIEEELKRKAREAKTAGGLETKEGDKIISKNFEQNKGRLPWPVVKCIVSRKFGHQRHKTVKDVYEDNLGIFLQTQTSASVRSVFDGKVVSVMDIPGSGKAIMIQHGGYYTFYGGLSSTLVKTGQFVNAKTPIGKVGVGAYGHPELDFQIWKGMTNLDPLPWLYK